MTSSRTKAEREKRRGLVAVRSISNRGGLINRGKLRRSFSLPLPLVFSVSRSWWRMKGTTKKKREIEKEGGK